MKQSPLSIVSFCEIVFFLLATLSFVHSASDLDNTDSSGLFDEHYVYDYYDDNNRAKDSAQAINVQSQVNHDSVTVTTTASKLSKLEDYYDYDDDYDDFYNSKNYEYNNVIEGHQFIDPKPVDNTYNKNSEASTITESSTQKQTTQRSSRSKLLAIMAKPGILAGIVGGAIIGVLTAILLIMFIVYRMKKKDEGSYALEETKKPLNAYDYRHCPTKEFYA